jgi:hypothetical protein
MKRWLAFPSVQIGLCLGLFALLAYCFGPVAVVWASPLLGAAVARPCMNLLSSIRHSTRELVWLPVHGQHYVFKGVTIQVVEDEDHNRWIRLADVRAVLGASASERTLSLTYPGRLQSLGNAAQVYLRDDALIEHLAKQNDPSAIKFRNWVQRIVVLPGQNIRRNIR